MDFLNAHIEDVTNWFLTSGLQLLVILVSMLLLLYLTGKIIRQIEKGLENQFTTIEARKRITTLMRVLRMVVRTTIIVIGLMIVLSEIGIDMGPLLATFGVLGLAVSFGAQSLVKDLISGVFLLLEDKIRVGDVVSIKGMSGTVESIQLRVVVLRALNGDLHVIPNGTIEEFTNMTKDYSRALWNIGVGYGEDVDNVIGVIKEEGEKLVIDHEWSDKIRSPLKILGLQEMANSAIIIRCLLDTVPGEQWAITREFNKRLKKRFDLEGIEIPFPHRKVIIENVSSEELNTHLKKKD
jgi:small-conductance mechanosensitive channel